ncbi:dTDP-4-dehydrorhamnose 3,5-epimerase family protein, partial [Vibrio sp. 10N.222.54.B11]
VPEGFAHGFYVMSDMAEFVYKCTDFYNPTAEISIAWNDPELGVEWPLTQEQSIQLSEKDQCAISFSQALKSKL